jgi:nucleoside-diphosphate-sugar epimerase
VVIHAAATFPDKMRYGKADVDGFVEAEEAAIAALVGALGPNCKAFLVSSGAYVYGDTGAGPVEESFSTAGRHLIMEHKVELEERLFAMARAGKAPAIVVRPGLVYGDGSLWGKFFLEPMKQGKRAMLPGDGKNLISVVHADDVGEAYVRIAERGRPGEAYNVGDDEPAPMGDVIRAQATILGAPSPRAVPRWLIRLVAGKYSGPPPLANTAIDSRKLKALGWRPAYPSYREGLIAVAKKVAADRKAKATTSPRGSDRSSASLSSA